MADLSESVQQWIKKAKGDLRSAQLLPAADPPESDAVAFHAQQAVEKYLKAYLVHLGVNPPRTHDLITLFDLIAPHDDRLEPLRESARPLGPLAVQVRYPFADATVDEAREALRLAEEISTAIRKLLPEQRAEPDQEP